MLLNKLINILMKLKRRNNIRYVIWNNIKIFINNTFNSKCPNCGHPIRLHYDYDLNDNVYICDNCKKNIFKYG